VKRGGKERGDYEEGKRRGSGPLNARDRARLGAPMAATENLRSRVRVL
jgi:hypothetical protein